MKNEAQGSSAAQAAPAEGTEFSLIPRATLECLYGNLLKDRVIEARSRGQVERNDAWAAVKAAAAAVLMDLVGEDLVATSDEVPLVRLLRGDTDETIVRESKKSNYRGAPLLLHAVGAALANRTKKNSKVAVVFWRDAEQESWLEALEMARAYTLPLILVCPESEPKKDTRGLTPGTELPRIVVDGHDAVAVYRVAHEAIDRARRNRGATLIECARFHVTGLRGKHADAVANMERYLRGKGMLRSGMKSKIEAGFANELKAARKKSKRAGA